MPPVCRKGATVKLRLLVSTLGAVVLALTALTACGSDGDGGGLSLEEYFRRLNAIQDEVDERSEAVPEPAVDDDDLLTEDEKEALRDYISQLVAILRDAFEAAADLDPPAEITAEHDAFVAAGQELVRIQEQFQDSLPDLLAQTQSTSELETLFTDFSEGTDAAAAGDRFGQACSQLQAVAAENSIDIDLDCADEA